MYVHHIKNNQLFAFMQINFSCIITNLKNLEFLFIHDIFVSEIQKEPIY